MDDTEKSPETTYDEDVLQHDIAMDPNKYTTNEILDVCEETNASMDESSRTDCVKSFEEVHNLVPPDELQLYTEKVLEKEMDLSIVQPKTIYNTIQGYFGSDIVPTYNEYISTYQDAITKVAKDFEPELLDIASGSDAQIRQYCSLQGLKVEPYNRQDCLNAIFSEKSYLGRDIHKALTTILKRFDGKGSFTLRKEMLNKLKLRYSDKFVSTYNTILDKSISSYIRENSSSDTPEDKQQLQDLSGIQKEKKEKRVRFKEEKSKTQTSTKKGKSPTKRKKKRLELTAKEKILFEDINKSISDNIVSFTPFGIDFIFYESLDELPTPTYEMLLKQTKAETNTFYKLRKHILNELGYIRDIQLRATNKILLSYLFANKILYGVKYPHNVETTLNYIRKRL